MNILKLFKRRRQTVFMERPISVFFYVSPMAYTYFSTGLRLAAAHAWAYKRGLEVSGYELYQINYEQALQVMPANLIKYIERDLDRNESLSNNNKTL